MTEFGIVVVGLGIAGRVRVRDTLQCAEYKASFPVLADVKLVGYVSRRLVDIEGAENVKFEAALKREDVNAFIICTENALHEEYARKCLAAGKHVLVEYPLTLKKTEADYLLETADQNRVFCCEENIALLTDDFKRLEEATKGKLLEKGEQVIMSGWVENAESSGSPFITSVSRLHIVMSLFGELTPIKAQLKISETEVEAFAELHTKDMKPITLKFFRKKGENRRMITYRYTLNDGTVLENPAPVKPTPGQPPNKPGLFLRDFISFMEAVKEGKPRMPTNEMTVKAIGLAEKLTEMAKQSSEN